MNTFIARKDNGDKISFLEGNFKLGGLNPEYEAKYCDCDENTTNTSEIADWDTALDVSYVIDE